MQPAPGAVKQDLAAIREIHTKSGQHVVEEIPFPEWVPPEVMEEAQGLEEDAAASALGEWLREHYLGRKTNAT